MTPLQKQIEDIKDALASIERTANAASARLNGYSLGWQLSRKNWLGSSVHYPRTMTGELGDKRMSCHVPDTRPKRRRRCVFPCAAFAATSLLRTGGAFVSGASRLATWP